MEQDGTSRAKFIVKDDTETTITNSVITLKTKEVYQLTITFVKFAAMEKFKLRIEATNISSTEENIPLVAESYNTYLQTTQVAQIYDTYLDMKSFSSTSAVPVSTFKFKFRFGSLSSQI